MDVFEGSYKDFRITIYIKTRGLDTDSYGVGGGGGGEDLREGIIIG